MQDALTAEKFKQSTTVVIAKAEAYYNMGQFEMALVYYYRSRRALNDGEIERGMAKCRSAILNVVDGDLNYDEDLVGQVVAESKKEIVKIYETETRKKQKEPKEQLYVFTDKK